MPKEWQLCDDLAPGRAAHFYAQRRARGSPPCSRRPGSSEPPVGADKPEVQHGVRDLHASARLEVWQQLEPAGVVGAVVHPAQRDEPDEFRIRGLLRNPVTPDSKEAKLCVDDRSRCCLHLVQRAGARPASEYANRLDGLGEMV